VSELEFKQPQKSETVKDVTPQQEGDMYNNAAPRSPNCVFIPLGKLGYISWQSESSISVLAFMMFCLAVLAMILIGIAGLFNSAATWPLKAMELLGQALLAIIGAILGASARK
jgi:hypothetical protein